MSGKIVKILLVIALLFSLNAEVWAGKGNDTLNIAIQAEIPNVDKYFNTTRGAMIIQRLAYDSLLYLDPMTMQIKPALAESYKWIDKKTLEFKLRQGVRFHDGSDFDSADVAYTFNWIKNPRNKVKTKNYVHWIDYAQVVDTYTVRLHLNKTMPSVLQYLAGANAIYAEGSYDQNGAQSQNLHPNGTGPYRIIKFDLGKKVVFKKFEGYYKNSPKGLSTIGNITIQSIPDFSTQMVELLSGRIDFMYNVPTDMADNLESINKVNVSRGPSMRIAYMMMDAAGKSGVNPFQKQKVRQAVAHAIDRQAIVKNIIKGSSKVIHAACNPVQFGCTDNVKKYNFDPQKSRQLLKEAGYPDGFKTVIGAYRERQVAEAVIGYLRDVGIKADLKYAKWGATRKGWQKGELPIVFTTWGSSSLADVSAFTPVFFSLGPDDLAMDKQVAEWIGKAEVDTNKKSREENYIKGMKKIAEKVYWVPMHVMTLNYVYAKNLMFKAPKDGLPRLFSASWK